MLLFLISIGSAQKVFGQYITGIGLRTGVTNGVSVRHFIGQESAIEGLLHSRWGGLIVTGLYEIHKDIRPARGLGWYFGGGAHYGTWNAKNSNRSWGDNRVSTNVYGLDAIIGLDYVFGRNSPFNLSCDWKPAINFGEGGFWWDEIGISVRYVF